MRTGSRSLALGLVLAACGPSGPSTVTSFGDEGMSGSSEGESSEDESSESESSESESSEDESTDEGEVEGALLDLPDNRGRDLPPGDPGCGSWLPGFPVMVAGETLAAGNEHQGSCATNPAPEREYWWVAPFAGSFTITTAGSELDTVLYVRDGGCEGPELACNDDTSTLGGTELWSTVSVELEAGQTISIFVDGYNGAGEFELSVHQ